MLDIRWLILPLVVCLSGAPADLPSSREIAPGVYTLGFSARYGSVNVGWVEFDDHVLLIGLPHPELIDRIFTEVKKTTHKPVREVVLTHIRKGEVEAAEAVVKRQVTVLVHVEQVLQRRDAHHDVQLIPMRPAGDADNTAVFVRDQGVLFAGALCSNGPRAEVRSSDTARWIDALDQLKRLPVRKVVPGFGSMGGPELLDRQARYLRELRRQVGYGVAQGVPLAEIRAGVRIAPEFLVWMPYDHPTAEDIDHVYAELTVPQSPFGRGGQTASDGRPRALVLIGDRFHDPAHLEAGLRLAFDKAGVAADFTVDVRALSAENLKGIRLLVILRDGMLWPEGPDKPYVVWMTPEQERAVVDFVQSGGALLALHNATGLYPAGGPYLKVLGGTYNGHGPLERFRVRVTDPRHPITRGITEYEVADEQHTPIPDLTKVHIFLESRSDDGVVAPAGWAYEAGRGRVCYLANGHTREALLQPSYQLLLKNAIHWCLGHGEPKSPR